MRTRFLGKMQSKIIKAFLICTGSIAMFGVIWNFGSPEAFRGLNFLTADIVDEVEIIISTICEYDAWHFENSTTVLLPFTTLLNETLQKCLTDSKTEFALVIPDQLYENISKSKSISISALIDLVRLLKKNDWLRVAAGTPLVLNPGENPACTMKKDWHSIHLSENYSEFENASNPISASQTYVIDRPIVDTNRSISNRYRLITNSIMKCYPCDLLPDVFLIKLSSLDTSDLIELQASARVPLFLNLKGRSAYCPSLKMVATEMDSALTCNNLRMIWDDNFVLLLSLLDVYRLVLHQSDGSSIDHWLGCSFSRVAHESKTPLDCSHWNRQHLFEMADFLEKVKKDYWLIFGTLLGAARNGDLIPWTADVDILIDEPETNSTWRDEVLSKLDILTHERYSHFSK